MCLKIYEIYLTNIFIQDVERGTNGILNNLINFYETYCRRTSLSLLPDSLIIVIFNLKYAPCGCHTDSIDMAP
ncbi:unnamed protein product [Caretta caretta]